MFKNTMHLCKQPLFSDIDHDCYRWICLSEYKETTVHRSSTFITPCKQTSLVSLHLWLCQRYPLTEGLTVLRALQHTYRLSGDLLNPNLKPRLMLCLFLRARYLILLMNKKRTRIQPNIEKKMESKSNWWIRLQRREYLKWNSSIKPSFMHTF